ncbi:MAG: ribosome maturation factor RimM [Candidatus Humimicrobiaceae bacterium]|jgi:16S rRNA processing protein RimM|nr:ribosome maturation factor RimM [Actinomycetota bacterium]MDY0028243.1 ribosome maturation factor RimM [Candidatus Humimicrobiaceae bacterium]
MLEINVDARLIGIISKPHGVKGEVVMTLLTDYPNTIKKGIILFFDEKCTLEAEVEGVKRSKAITGENAGFLIIKFKGVNDRKKAESLRNTGVFRSIENSPSLKKNQFWTDDIIGCRVYLENLTFVGIVKDVEKHKANDNIVVEVEGREGVNASGIKDNILYIPVIKDYIKDIDIKNRKVILKKIPEYT